MPKYSRLRSGHILARRWFAKAGLEAHADAYIRYLTEHGYAVPTVECYFRCVAHFLHWAVQQHAAFHDVGDALIDRFIHGHLPHCQCAPQCRRTSADVHAALMHFLDMYGIARATPTPIVSASIDAELAIFTRYMTEVRGLSESTRHVRRRHIGEFLADCFHEQPIEISKIAPADVVRFVMRRTRGLTPGSVKSVGGSLHSYLRFKAISGTPVTALIAALPRVALWRLGGLPDVLSPEEVQRLLSAFDRSNATGMRDYAITRCLLDLGLRRTEVAHLCLDDIDWRAGILTLHGKGKRIDVVPLPRLTGQAIAAYLQYGRPQTTRREIFVRHRPPLNAGADLDIVRNAVRYAAKRCGLEQRVRGTHIFRHTIACRIAQGGAPFKQIADLLRHRDLDTTTIYAKVDLPSLRRVALPWPGSYS
jgi:integrase/recombinase XerD